MNQFKRRRDPPSAASIVSGNEETPTFSLNSRQLGMLAGRERRKDDEREGQNRPLMTKSNQHALSDVAGERHGHSNGLRGNRQPRLSTGTDDGDLLRRVLVQANQNSRYLASDGRLSSSKLSLDLEESNKPSTVSGDRQRNGQSAINTEPPGHVHQQSKRRIVPTPIQTAQSIAAGESRDGVRSDSTNSQRGQRKWHGNSLFGITDRSTDRVSRRKKTRDDEQSSTSSEKRVEERKRIMEMRALKEKFDDKKSVRSATSAKSDRPKQNDERARNHIQEKLRRRKESTKRDNPPNSEGFDFFTQTLQHEAFVHNSQLWESFSAKLDNRPLPELQPKKPAKGYKFDTNTYHMLSMLNMHLKDKGSDFVDVTQLVNDKVVAKQISRGLLPPPELAISTRHFDRGPRPGAVFQNPQIDKKHVDHRTRTNQIDKKRMKYDDKSSDHSAETESIENDAIIQTRSDSSPKQDGRRYIGKRPKKTIDFWESKSRGGTNAEQENIDEEVISTTMETTSNAGFEVTLDEFESKVNSVPPGPSADRSVETSSAKSLRSRTGESADFVTQRSRSPNRSVLRSPTRRLQIDTGTKEQNETSKVPPWTQVRLRSVLEKGDSESRSGSITPPAWASVQLRKVDGKRSGLENDAKGLSETNSRESRFDTIELQRSGSSKDSNLGSHPDRQIEESETAEYSYGSDFHNDGNSNASSLSHSEGINTSPSDLSSIKSPMGTDFVDPSNWRDTLKKPCSTDSTDQASEMKGFSSESRSLGSSDQSAGLYLQHSLSKAGSQDSYIQKSRSAESDLQYIEHNRSESVYTNDHSIVKAGSSDSSDQYSDLKSKDSVDTNEWSASKRSAYGSFEQESEHLPKRGPKKVDQAVVYKLKSTSVDEDLRVVIGSKVIMVVEAEPGAQGANVLWRLKRDQVQPLAFDLSCKQVKLVSKDNRETKFLDFQSTPECLQFINSFYQNVDDRVERNEAGLDESAIDDDFAALRMECLNEEEKSLLQKYRSLRQTKDAREALQETIPKQANNIGPPFNPTNQVILERYQKMLRDNVPIEQVRQRMAEAGIDSAVAANMIEEAEKNFPQYIATPDMPTSPVSTFSASVVLSDTEVEMAKTYQKLLRFGVPIDGVRDKMRKDNIDDKIVSFVLGEQQEQNTESSEIEKAATKYRKMLSLGIPLDAVRQSMMRDQVDSRVVDLINKDATPADAAAKKLSPEDEKLAEAYRKMLKVGLPKDAVHHRMVKDQIDEQVINAVLGAEFCEGSSQITSSTTERSSVSKRNNESLTDDEASIVSQFKRMLKLQIPRDQVLDRMEQEGVSDKIIKHVLGTSARRPGTSDDASHASSRGSSKLVSLHWTPLSGEQLNNSLWRATKLPKTEDTQPTKLAELFQKKPKAATQVQRQQEDNRDAPTKARLIDLNRSNNIAISLKAFKEFSYEELAEIIMYLDASKKLRGDRVPFLRDLLPTATEIKAVKEYQGSDDRLVPAERWFRRIVSIKRIETKVKVMRTMEMVKIEASAVGESLELLQTVCQQVMDSEKLQDLLAMVLAIGNVMNEGTRTGRAAGFKFDSLLKLTQTKSSDGKITVLDHLVTVYVESGRREVLDLTSDFPDCQTASRMLISDLLAEVTSVQESLEQCRTELKQLQKDASARVPPRAEQDGPRSESSSVQGALVRLESGNGSSIFAAIDRLQKFIESAEAAVKDLDGLKKETINASREMSRYCGEGNNTGATSTLLGILSQFAANIDEALKSYDIKNASTRKRKERRGDDDGSDDLSSKQESQVQPRTNLESETIATTVSDQKNNSDADAEQRVPSTGHRKDLASKIQEKSEGVDEGTVEEVRSRFGSPHQKVKMIQSGNKMTYSELEQAPQVSFVEMLRRFETARSDVQPNGQILPVHQKEDPDAQQSFTKVKSGDPAVIHCEETIPISVEDMPNTLDFEVREHYDLCSEPEIEVLDCTEELVEPESILSYVDEQRSVGSTGWQSTVFEVPSDEATTSKESAAVEDSEADPSRTVRENDLVRQKFTWPPATSATLVSPDIHSCPTRPSCRENAERDLPEESELPKAMRGDDSQSMSPEQLSNTARPTSDNIKGKAHVVDEKRTQNLTESEEISGAQQHGQTSETVDSELHVCREIDIPSLAILDSTENTAEPKGNIQLPPVAYTENHFPIGLNSPTYRTSKKADFSMFSEPQSETSDAPSKDVEHQSEATDAPSKDVEKQSEATDAPSKVVEQQPNTTDAPASMLVRQSEITDATAFKLIEQSETTVTPASLLVEESETTNTPASMLVGQSETTDTPASLFVEHYSATTSTSASVLVSQQFGTPATVVATANTRNTDLQEGIIRETKDASIEGTIKLVSLDDKTDIRSNRPQEIILSSYLRNEHVSDSKFNTADYGEAGQQDRIEIVNQNASSNFGSSVKDESSSERQPISDVVEEKTGNPVPFSTRKSFVRGEVARKLSLRQASRDHRDAPVAIQQKVAPSFELPASHTEGKMESMDTVYQKREENQRHSDRTSSKLSVNHVVEDVQEGLPRRNASLGSDVRGASQSGKKVEVSDVPTKSLMEMARLRRAQKSSPSLKDLPLSQTSDPLPLPVSLMQPQRAVNGVDIGTKTVEENAQKSESIFSKLAREKREEKVIVAPNLGKKTDAVSKPSERGVSNVARLAQQKRRVRHSKDGDDDRLIENQPSEEVESQQFQRQSLGEPVGRLSIFERKARERREMTQEIRIEGRPSGGEDDERAGRLSMFEKKARARRESKKRA